MLKSLAILNKSAECSGLSAMTKPRTLVEANLDVDVALLVHDGDSLPLLSGLHRQRQESQCPGEDIGLRSADLVRKPFDRGVGFLGNGKVQINNGLGLD